MAAVVSMTMEGHTCKIVLLFSLNQNEWSHAEVDPHICTEKAARCVSDEPTTHSLGAKKKKKGFSGNYSQNKIKSVLKGNPKMDLYFKKEATQAS